MDNLPVSSPQPSAPARLDSSPWPTADLQMVLRACNPSEPLQPGDPRYVDLGDLRRGVNIKPLCRRLKMVAPEGSYHHGLLCGHRGSGKSTELLALQQWANEAGFLAARTEVNEHFGMIELDHSDLFLLAAVVVEKVMQDFGNPLPEEKIRRVIEWFKEVVQEDTDETRSEIGVVIGAQLGGHAPFSLGSLFAKLTASFKGATTHSRKTREILRRYPDTLITLTRDLLNAANETLRSHGKERGLLLIFDNLDRYDPVNVDAVLVRSSQQMREMAYHAVFTFPILLAYQPITGRVSAEYGTQIVLPMLALRSRHTLWETTVAASEFLPRNVERMRGVLLQRIDVERLFEKPEDVDLLVKMSGGAIRDLVQLVSSAATHTEDEEKITTEAVIQAIKALRSVYTRFLTTRPRDYRCLAAVAKRLSVSTGDDDLGEELNRLLFNGCLLEYGENGESWWDVHPVLIETEEFRYACGAH